MKYTKGPWKIEGQDIKAEGEYICTWSGNRNNAKLIAHAPEMLEALIRIMRYKGYPGMVDGLRDAKTIARPIVEKICLPEQKLKLHPDFYKKE
jgi:hypothetical protein